MQTSSLPPSPSAACLFYSAHGNRGCIVHFIFDTAHLTRLTRVYWPNSNKVKRSGCGCVSSVATESKNTGSLDIIIRTSIKTWPQNVTNKSLFSFCNCTSTI